MVLPVDQLEIVRDLLREEEEEEAVVGVVLAHVMRHRRRPRQYWTRPWIARRLQFGHYHNLMAELERESHGDFVSFLRMEPAMFYELLERITPRISKQTTNWRKPLDPGLKLAVTLRYLATGNSYHSLAFNFRVAHNSISIFVREVCEAIIEELGEEVVSVPDTEDKWREVASKFETRWNFPHTLGAIDGKHIAMKSPTNSGTVYHNYKGFFSLILLGLVDADYKFLWVDVGANGSTSDCAVFNQSNLKASLENGTLLIPAPEPLPQDDIDMPYFIVGDDAFPLHTSMMKPFSSRRLTDEERIFNYRLSRARRIVENAFGILANRFRCLLTTMPQEPKTVTTIAMAAVC